VGCKSGGWKELRHRRTFPVTHSLSTNRVPFCTLKRRFFGKFDPLLELFWMRATTWARGHGKFGGSRSKESGRSGASYTSQKTTVRRPIFFALSPKPVARFHCKRARLSLFRPQPQLPSFIQIHLKFPRFISENDLPDRYNIRRSDLRSDPDIRVQKDKIHIRKHNIQTSNTVEEYLY